MACRGCSSGDGCSCSVIGGEGISVTGTGTPVTSPYVVTLDLAESLEALSDDNSDCELMDDPRVPTLLGDGSVVLVPLPCNDTLETPVPGQAFAFTWDGDTDGAPGDGQIQFDDTDYTAVITVYASTEEVNGTNVLDWAEGLASIGSTPKGLFKIYSRTNPAVWATFQMVALYTGTVGVLEFDVVYMDHSGTFSDEIPGDVVLDFAPASTGSLGGFDSIQAITTVTGAYGITTANLGEYLRCGNASPFSVTVPAESTEYFYTGSHIDLIQTGAGQVTVAAAGGVTIHGAPGLKLNGQWAAATLIKVGTDEWDLVGNLAS